MKRRSGNRMQWIAAGVLAILCSGLAVVQYRWTGELSTAELEQLQKQARQNLEQLRNDFNTRISRAVSALTPANGEVEREGREAYWTKVVQSRTRRESVFSRIALAIPNHGDIDLMVAGAESFEAAAWPAEWHELREWLHTHVDSASGPIGPPFEPALRGVFAIPRFGSSRNGEPFREQEWLLLELDRKWLSDKLMPELLTRHFGAGAYDAAIFAGVTGARISGAANASAGRGRELIYESGPGVGKDIAGTSDGEIDILPAVRLGRGGDRGPNRGPSRGPDRAGDRPRVPGSPGFRGGPARGDDFGGPGRWSLAIRHHAGSLETIVAQSRQRNIAVSLGVLLLILVTSALLLRTAREQTRLAELQMNFVAGVSHELRTPLTVIRTAAFNLQGKVAGKPEHVERYGRLIHEESTKLMGMVEQVLLLARGRAATAEKRLISPAELLQRSLRVSMAGADPAPCEVECTTAPGLPDVSCDEQAMTQALRNLIDNAVKYGVSGGWVGISADRRNGHIEIRVADRGPGIPAEERAHIFDEFFRGHKAIDDQIHGTGLGLSLASRIVEDHGGEIHVQDHAGGGAEFVVSLPIAKESHTEDNAAHPAG